MTTNHDRFANTLRLAKQLWPGQIKKQHVEGLRILFEGWQLSLASGDLQLLEGRWYVTHAGLLRLAERRRCAGITTSIDRRLSDPILRRWVCKAIVYKRDRRTAFAGYGDADPSNVSPLVRGAEMRVAETRAVNRALRKAYGIGICSVEELGYLFSRPEPSASTGVHGRPNGNPTENGNARLRDRLCLLIREHQLDPALVKRYAADFCGTPELRDASREQVESFINHIGEWAGKDRAGLVFKLNSFGETEEVRP